jgi:PAS domain S-box-containing protein
MVGKNVEETLPYRNEIESLLALISMQFVKATDEEIDDAMQQALHIISELLKVDRSYVYLLSADGGTMKNVYEWCAAGIESYAALRQELPTFQFSWSMERLQNRDVIKFSRMEEVPGEAKEEYRGAWQAGTRSLLSVPLIHSGSVMGFVGFDAVRSERWWSGEEVRVLRILASLFASALARKRSTAKLRLSEERFRQAFEEGPVAMSLVDADGRYVQVNQAYCRLLGYTAEEVVGHPVGIFTHPEDLTSYWEPTQRVLRGEQSKLMGETRYRHKDGRFIWARVTGAGLHDRAGKGQYALTLPTASRRKS